jgi:hypothetical protein
MRVKCVLVPQQASASLLFGADSANLKAGNVASCQAVAGTGALRLAADFIARELPRHLIYIPEPTWENHAKIFVDVGVRGVRAAPTLAPAECSVCCCCCNHSWNPRLCRMITIILRHVGWIWLCSPRNYVRSHLGTSWRPFLLSSWPACGRTRVDVIPV